MSKNKHYFGDQITISYYVGFELHNTCILYHVRKPEKLPHNVIKTMICFKVAEYIVTLQHC